MSAYQIAIHFAEAHQDHPLVRRLEVGGERTGEHQSLAQRIARFLSDAAQAQDSVIQGGFISHQDIKEFSFNNNGNEVRVSGLNGPAHSIFRVKPTR